MFEVGDVYVVDQFGSSMGISIHTVFGDMGHVLLRYQKYHFKSYLYELNTLLINFR